MTIYLHSDNKQYKGASNEVSKMLKKVLARGGDPLGFINEYAISCSAKVFKFILNRIVPMISILMQYELLDALLWTPLQEKYSSLDRVMKKAEDIFSMESDEKCVDAIHRIEDHINDDASKKEYVKQAIISNMSKYKEWARQMHIDLGLDDISEYDNKYREDAASVFITRWTAWLKKSREEAARNAQGESNKKGIVIMNKKTHKKYLFDSYKECKKFLGINGRDVFNRWLHGSNVKKCSDYIIVNNNKTK